MIIKGLRPPDTSLLSGRMPALLFCMMALPMGRGWSNRPGYSLLASGVNDPAVIQYEIDSHDFSDLIEKLKSSADVIYFGGYSTEIGLITRRAANIQYFPHIVAGDSLHNTDFG